MSEIPPHLIEQALFLADKLNEAALDSVPKPSARIQYVAHVLAALGLAVANGISLDKVLTNVRHMYKEMARTEREAKKPSLSLVKKEPS